MITIRLTTRDGRALCETEIPDLDTLPEVVNFGGVIYIQTPGAAGALPVYREADSWSAGIRARVPGR
jgi:hypothetical protein